MLSAIAIVPSAPVLVPELASGAAAELAELRDAVFDAAAVLPDRWVAVGVGSVDAVVGPDAAGTFAGYGVDVPVVLAPGGAGVPSELPLCALITGWVRGRVNPRARADVRVYAGDHRVAAAVARGRALRAELDESADAVGVLVVADGAHTLTPPAPGGYDPDSAVVQASLDDALGSGDVAALVALPEGVVGRVAYQVLAGLTEPAPASARELYRGAPYGVGYFAGVWTPAGRSEATRGSIPASRPIAIIGPTGTGKSALALEVAERVGGEVVNADAMQLYRGMDIGTAKLTPAERRGIPHHQLDVLDVTQTATVARYQEAAAADVEAIAARGAVPVLVGGSMLYVQSLLDEWAFPATDPAVRARWEDRLAEVGTSVLHAELARVDAAAAASILPTDGRRIVRALEVVELTGRPFAASAPTIGPPRWNTAIIGLDWDTARLDERLAQRTDIMFDDGLVGEVAALLDRGLRDGVTAARALGYAQVLEALDAGGDAASLAEARERTFIGTRRYVRRQRSWFRRDHRIHWLDGSADGNADAVLRVWG